MQEAQARRNAASKEIGQAKAKKDETRAKRLMDEVAALKSTIQEGEADGTRLDGELRNLLAAIPNMPAADVPVGPDADANKEIRKVGTPKKFAFQPKQHFELGEALGLMDFETAAKLSGARFVVLKGALARLERALVPVHARPAHNRARLYRDQPAAAGARRHHVRHRATAKISRTIRFADVDDGNVRRAA